MGGPLDRIRGKKHDNQKKKKSEDKIKRLQIRWNRPHDKEGRCKTAKPTEEESPGTSIKMAVTRPRKINLTVPEGFATCSTSSADDHSPGPAIANRMDNSHHQHETVYPEQQPQLPSASTEANNMNTILTTKIQNNSASPFFANLIDSVSAANLYLDGQ